MRMRRKKHLETRLEGCTEQIIDLQGMVANRRFDAIGQQLFDLDTLFGRKAPIQLEIGCGKGGFICQLAARHPEINFLAMEKYANVLVTAAEAAAARGLTNIRFLWGDAEYLSRFIPSHTVQQLYINFSTPYPKKRYAVHRLTHPHFLEMYKGLLAPGATVVQKTDNRALFQYSLTSFSGCGYTLRDVSLDLHADDYPDNIVTEYEQKFVSEGLPIYRLEASIP